MAAALERTIPCQHRVLWANATDSIYATPCADCGAIVVFSWFVTHYGNFYIVATEDTHPPLPPPPERPKLTRFERFVEWLLP